jgi:PAS domain S-box-containing protein
MGHIVNSIDIETLLRDARKDLAETLQALRVSEARSRSQAEQLRALSDELSTILNTAGIGITRCSRDLRYLRANETYATIAGLPLAQIIGRPIVEVMGEAAFITIRPYIERVLAGERVEYESEIPFRRGVESSFYRVVYVPDRDPYGSIIGWIACVSDITASKQAERAALAALAGRAALVGNHADDPVLEKMTICDGYAAIHGLPEGTTETTRREWRARVHPEDLARVEENRARNFHDKLEVYNVDYRILRASGEVRWIEARGIVAYDADGQPRRVVGINIDVTERKQVESLLKESKTRLSDALTAGQVVAFEWDAATGHSQRSDNADRIMGLVGDGCFLKQVRPDDRDDFGICIRGLSPGNPSYALTFRFVRSDGGQVWLEETARGEFDGKGRLLRVKGLTRDITERKEAELALAERNAQLALAGRAALVGVYAYDVKAEKVQISEGYAAIFGFPDGTTEMPRSQWVARVHPEDLERIEDLRNRAFRDRQDQYNTEYRIHVPGRGVYWIEARSFISYDGDGHPRRVAGVNIDVTQRKRAEERQSVLVAELDHRVKNVLASVSAVVSHTQRESTSVANFVEALDGRIRSMAMTHELLSSNRWQGISLGELVRCELAPYAIRHNTEIDGPEVLLKPEAGQAMAMVLHELATNAAKYGALSTEYGYVAVRWDRRLNGQARPLELEWRESGGPLVVATGKPSYGTSTIRNLIPYEFGGTVDLALAPEGVCCRLELSADWLSNDGEAFSRSIMHANEDREKYASRQAAQEALRRDVKPYRKRTRGRPEKSREHIDSALRAVDARIGEGERRLFGHVKLMERLKDRGTAQDVTMAHRLQLNLEVGLLLMRASRETLLREFEQD